MNDNDLERRLRSESGPREQGYAAVPLPDAPDPARRAGRSGPAVRGALVLATVGAGVLAVAVAAALMSPGAPSGGVGAGGEATATPATAKPSVTAQQPTDCQPADLDLKAEPWGGAAGSRGTVVSVYLAEGRYPCNIERNIGASIRDAQGSTLVSAIVPMIHDPVLLKSGQSYDVGIAWSNWCDGNVAEPVDLVLTSGAIEFPVAVPDGIDPVPPCMGQNAPSNLSSTGLQRAK